ncbi:hypothetical protein BP6252_12252 [Coleophoma cylindrospora]|uniref:YCII-related domain-containing protein n=1 Tax=Coleophoma cylindrospora TaxID=1849047 RepID=A0A3D8QGG0_9HELO|nr:hypothetical protein BP6252_12252 [Coleophoma cylindrospora]
MAASTTAATPAKFEWLVILPDFEDNLEHRLEVRPKHFAGLSAAVEAGNFRMGGALLEEVPKEGEGMKMMGSALVAMASTKEEVIEMIKNDPYAKEKVWDLNKMQIYPFKSAFYKP